ncbi:iron uptake transporter deferrochelatase/peroxidase subunit [Paenibacillus glufosinatiresistens]|uniref:iron uptake transporter deferrochelatase/peroxidase subunit n=1 Tax=Paenibacillus glufosinatiresistens TaxID=3070657 RepID=UPI00286D71FC|nr:iron uptake transporter deferrochelatase/peroxidase subunit [Paenibacillus sp. YX.27]
MKRRKPWKSPPDVTPLSGPDSPPVRPADEEAAGPSLLNKPVSRRDMLRLTAASGLGLLLGGGAVGALAAREASPSAAPGPADTSDASLPFYGSHQAGIVTPAQSFICFASFDVTASGLPALRRLMQSWTEAAAALTAGRLLGDANDRAHVPPTDTGEADGLNPARLTLTFGAGPSLFDGRFGLAGSRPATFAELPAFNGDQLEPEWCGGDLCVQACSDDLQVAFHAIRNLARIARGTAVLRWTQEGFQRTGTADPRAGTPRNLLGFKDGTGNPDISDSQAMNEIVWCGGEAPAWMQGGTYMAVRRVRLRLEIWDRSSLADQEATFGRHRASGAPLGSAHEFDPLDPKATDSSGNLRIPADSHSALARGDGSVKMLRRSFSYSSGLSLKTGQLDAGLLFISFQRDLQKQFVAVQRRLAASDKLNEYQAHVGSAVFACFPGVREGAYLGQALLG